MLILYVHIGVGGQQMYGFHEVVGSMRIRLFLRTYYMSGPQMADPASHQAVLLSTPGCSL